jgi:peptidyl-prolyl cis-trans isomerase C
MLKRYSLLLVTFITVSFVFCGCDIISSKKSPVTPQKTESTSAVKAAPSEPQPVAKAVSNPDEPLPKDVLARIGDWTLTTAEFNQRIEGIKKAIPEFDSTKPDSKRMVLDELIRQQLLVQEARSENLDRSKEIKDAVRDFENTLLVQEYVSKLTQDVKASEKDAKDYYDNNVDLFVKPVERQLREIVVPTEVEAKDILVQILQGADFTQTAKDRSKSKSAAAGGDLGVAAEAPFEQMQKAVAGLTKGGVSSVFQGPEGFYIVKVEDIKGGEKANFEDVKEDLIKGLSIQKQQQVVLEKMADISKKINVKINKDLIDKIGE